MHKFDFENLIKKLESGEYEDSGMTINGSKIYIVYYGTDTDQRLRFWNDSSSDSIDCEDSCKAIAELLSDEGIDVQDNTVQDGWNTVAFEIDDDGY